MDPIPATDVRIVLVTAPPDAAHALARRLVEQRLAACVNLVPGLRSVYRWQGAVADEPESLLVVKTTAQGLAALLEDVAEHHPYEVPEALALAPVAGSAPYLAWLRAALSPAGPAPDAAGGAPPG